MHDYKTPSRPKIYITDRTSINKMYKLLKERDYLEKELQDLGIKNPTQIANLCRKEGKNVKYRSEDLNKNPFNPNKNLIKTFYLDENE